MSVETTSNSLSVSRRTFLRVSSAAVGGLLVSFYLDAPLLAQQPPKPPQIYPPDAFIHVLPDGKIVIQVNRLEFGQGVQTSLPMLLADEMDADWSQVVAELAPAADVYRDPLFGIQMVGGSGSIAHSFQQYRELGARPRAMLVAAAAEQWKVAPGQCRTESSVVRGPNGQSAKYAELADAAARIPVPENVQLKKESDFRLAGKKVRRIDSRAKCDGSAKFGLDVDLPGMKVALVAHPRTAPMAHGIAGGDRRPVGVGDVGPADSGRRWRTGFPGVDGTKRPWLRAVGDQQRLPHRQLRADVLVRHPHRCACGREFKCTAPSCAGKEIICVCCRLEDIERRHAGRRSAG